MRRVFWAMAGLFLGGLSMVGLLTTTGCPSSKTKTEASQKLPPAVYKAFSAGQRVVATADQGRYLLTRAGGSIALWTTQGARLTSFLALVIDPKDPQARYAVSSDGKMLVEGERTSLRVSAPSGEILWAVELREPLTPLWADPVFSPDGTLLALPMQGRVTLLDTTSGKIVRHIGHKNLWKQTAVGRVAIVPTSGITLARLIVFSPDGKLVAITCQNNSANPSNHTVFIADVLTGAMVAEIPGFAQGVKKVLFVDDKRLLVLAVAGDLHLYESTGLPQKRWPKIRPFPQSFAVDAALNRLLVVGQRGRLWLWSSDGSVGTLTPRLSEPAVFVTIDSKNQAVLLDAQGQLMVTGMEQKTGTSRQVKPLVYQTALEQQAHAALWLIGKNDVEAAQKALAPFAQNLEHPVLAAAHAYTQIVSTENEQSLKTLLQGDNGYRGLLDLTRTYTESAMLAQAIPLYALLLKHRESAKEAALYDGEVQAIGRLLAEYLMANSQSASALKVVQWQRKLWPKSLAVAETYINTIQHEEPLKAEGVARQLIAEYPKDPKSYHLLIELLAAFQPDQVAQVQQQALRALDKKDHRTWALVALAYMHQAKMQQALEAYQKAIAMDPDNPLYLERIERLSKKAK